MKQYFLGMVGAILIAIIGILAWIIFSFSPAWPMTNKSEDQPQPTVSSQPADISNLEMTEEKTEDEVNNTIGMEMANFSFKTKELTLKAGETYTINLVNKEGMHDMVIDELNFKSRQLKAGETQELTLTIPMDAAGQEYEYYCSVGSHRQMGMIGKLKIEN